MEHLEQAVTNRPDNPFYHFQLGVALQLRGKYDAAVTAYEHAIMNNPEYADAYNNLANALKILGRNEEALVACERAIELMPQSAEAHFNHGSLLANLGNREDALQAYERAIQLRRIRRRRRTIPTTWESSMPLLNPTHRPPASDLTTRRHLTTWAPCCVNWDSQKGRSRSAGKRLQQARKPHRLTATWAMH